MVGYDCCAHSEPGLRHGRLVGFGSGMWCCGIWFELPVVFLVDMADREIPGPVWAAGRSVILRIRVY